MCIKCIVGGRQHLNSKKLSQTAPKRAHLSTLGYAVCIAYDEVPSMDTTTRARDVTAT